MSRLTKNDLPNIKTPCPYTGCVYNGGYQHEHCDNPRINKGNSDARCHKMSNKYLLAIIGYQIGKAVPHD